MEYSAGIVSTLFWFVETKEIARLLQNRSLEEVERLVFEDNILQQKKPEHIRKEFNCIMKRLNALPENLKSEFVDTDVDSAKLIAMIGVMATDQLLFEFIYEVYREKIRMEETELEDKDFNIFFNDKTFQSEKVASWSEAGIKKMKQSYRRYMFEAGLLEDTKSKKIKKVYLDKEIREILELNNMQQYIYALTGER